MGGFWRGLYRLCGGGGSLGWSITDADTIGLLQRAGRWCHDCTVTSMFLVQVGRTVPIRPYISRQRIDISSMRVW